MEAADYLAGIIAIQQKSANAVSSQGADAVAEHQPARVGLNGRSAVAKLDQLPGENRLEEDFALIPEVDVVGEHEINALVVLAREHGIVPIDFSGEDGHAFVLGGRAIQSDEAKSKKINRLHQFRHHDLAIEGRECRVVDVAAVVVLETDEPRILNAVALRGRGRKNDALRKLLLGLELNLVVRLGQHPNPPCAVLIFLQNPLRLSLFVHLSVDAAPKLLQ